ncbi:unnamed protein product [Symbiodinium sp. KB8]|nr:unnamed protein product [Symbiodinium sp. KB8]
MMVLGKYVAHGKPPGEDKTHGTHCAGIIAGNNYGVAKGASLVDVQVFGEGGGSSYSTILDGMNLGVDWAGACSRCEQRRIEFPRMLLKILVGTLSWKAALEVGFYLASWRCETRFQRSAPFKDLEKTFRVPQSNSGTGFTSYGDGTTRRCVASVSLGGPTSSTVPRLLHNDFSLSVGQVCLEVRCQISSCAAATMPNRAGDNTEPMGLVNTVSMSRSSVFARHVWLLNIVDLVLKCIVHGMEDFLVPPKVPLVVDINRNILFGFAMYTGIFGGSHYPLTRADNAAWASFAQVLAGAAVEGAPTVWAWEVALQLVVPAAGTGAEISWAGLELPISRLSTYLQMNRFGLFVAGFSGFINRNSALSDLFEKSGEKAVEMRPEENGSDSDWEVNSAVERMVAANIVVVVAAGNEAMNALYVSPASAPSAITVGSMGVSKVQGGDYVARFHFMQEYGDKTVAGAAAILLSQHSTLPASSMKEISGTLMDAETHQTCENDFSVLLDMTSPVLVSPCGCGGETCDSTPEPLAFSDTPLAFLRFLYSGILRDSLATTVEVLRG